MRLDFGASLRTANLTRVLLVVGALVVILACAFFLLQRQAVHRTQTLPPAATAAPRATAEVIGTLSIGDLERLLGDMSYDPEVMPADPQAPATVPAPAASPGPYLKISRRGYSFFIRFYDCETPATATGCQTIEVVSGSFMLKPAPTADEIVTWNRQSWWAFAVLDAEGLPFLRSYFSTTGGVSEAFIRNFFRLWDWRVTEFAKFIKDLGESGESAPD